MAKHNNNRKRSRSESFDAMDLDLQIFRRPRLDADELHNPTIVTVKVRENEHVEYTIFNCIREQLCKNSAFFRAAFQSRFLEAEEKSITLNDVAPWVFACFVNWLFDPQLRLKGQHLPEMDEETQSGTPWTWQWNVLFPLYIFGDKYDCKYFRNVVFEAIHERWNDTGGLFPSTSEITLVWENLPSSSPLRRLLIEASLECQGWQDDLSLEAGVTWNLRCPREYLAESLARAVKRISALECSRCNGSRKWACTEDTHSVEDAKRLKDRDPCDFHEHATDEDKRVCQSNRDMMMKVASSLS